MVSLLKSVSIPKPQPVQKKAVAKEAAREVAMTPAASAFFAPLEPVIVEEPTPFAFPGAISRAHIASFWSWVCRDVMPGIEMRFDGLIDSGQTPQAAMDTCLPELIASAKAIQDQASANTESDRRLTVQLGGEEVRERLDVIMLALKSRALIVKARGFAKAAMALADDAALGNALQSLPLKDPALAALLMQVLVGHFPHPSRLSTGASVVAGKATEEALRASGFAPLVDAMLAHAQNQLAILSTAVSGAGDTDLACRTLDRFHRLVRATDGYLEINRNSRWAIVLAELTKTASQRLEPRLREISGDVSQSLRRPRDGADRLDADRLLMALNGMYLLSAVREARESLALNALFEQVWSETGQAIEILVKRNLEEFKLDPTNEIIAKRLESGIKMAELRYNADYAEVLRKAVSTISRR